jgi:hypothetical protein
VYKRQGVGRTFESCWAGQRPDWPMRFLKNLLDLVDSAPSHQETLKPYSGSFSFGFGIDF